MLSAAAPAPIKRTLAPLKLNFLLELISDIKPIPSVEKSDNSSFSLASVFTALINFASFDIVPTIFAALFL